MHFEIREGKITKEIKNDGRRGDGEKTRNPMCDNCPHTNISEKGQDESLELDMVSLKEILKEYGAYDETDVVEELLD